MYVVIHCSFIFSVCIFIFYFSSEILAKFSYSVNPRLNKVCVCMYVVNKHNKPKDPITTVPQALC